MAHNYMFGMVNHTHTEDSQPQSARYFMWLQMCNSAFRAIIQILNTYTHKS